MATVKVADTCDVTNKSKRRQLPLEKVYFASGIIIDSVCDLRFSRRWGCLCWSFGSHKTLVPTYRSTRRYDGALGPWIDNLIFVYKVFPFLFSS